MTFPVSARNDCLPYTTKDGSIIREIMRAANQSLAEATVAHGQATALHYHRETEEIYYVLSGRGLMNIEGEERHVGAGDAVLIPPGWRHTIRNEETEDLVFLCCCAPSYSHEDTFLEGTGVAA